MRKFSIMPMAIGICILISVTPAFSLDTSSSLLCSVINVAECSTTDGCFESTAATFGLPQFVEIDFEKNMIRAVGEGQEVKKSKIKNLEQLESSIVMQGVENGRSWTVVIGNRGAMTATVSESDLGFVVFGACIAY